MGQKHKVLSAVPALKQSAQQAENSKTAVEKPSKILPDDVGRCPKVISAYM